MRRHFVITGAASGIGKALARRLGASGNFVIGIDVDTDRAAFTQRELEEEGIANEFILADLAVPEGRAKTLHELVRRPHIDVLVHSAGISEVGPFEKTDLETQRRVLQLNFLAPMLLTSDLLRERRLSESSSIVFISSLSHYVGYPGAAGYAASKDGLAAYARSLATDLGPRGMRVLTVFPGPVRTEHARRYAPAGASEKRRMAPDELAERILVALDAGKRRLVPGLKNRFLAGVGHIAPPLTERLVKRVTLDRLS